MLVTANQPFGEWNKIFPDPAMTLSAPHPSRHNLRDESRELSAPRGQRRKRGPESASVICHPCQYRR
jgi:hypothetical protein